MTREEFKDFVQKIVNIYGVRSYLNNLIDGEPEDENDLWFECPECGEPILYEDYGKEMNDYIDYSVNQWACPICEEILDI